MISTILVGNKQFSVCLGSRLRVERLKLKQGDLWLGKEVLAIQNDSGEAIFGEPFISKAQVKARIVRHGKAKKVLILKKNRRKGYRRTLGHRQQFTEIHIEALSDSTGQWITQKPQKSSSATEKAKVTAKPQKPSSATEKTKVTAKPQKPSSATEKTKVTAKPQKKLQKRRTTTIKKTTAKKPVKKRGS